MIILSARFTISIPNDLNDRIEAIATEKGIPKAAFITMLLKEHVEGESEIETIKKRLDVVEKEIAKLKKRK